jgi:hypothetical protein
MKKVLFVSLGILFSPFSFSQKMSREEFMKDSTAIMRPKLVRPQIKFDNRLTFYEGQTLAINGFDAGVLLKEKLRLTLGYYKLNEDLNAFKETIDSIDVGHRIKIEYGTINTEVIYRNTRYFSLGMPLEIGFGKSELKFLNTAKDEVTKTESGFLAMAHFGLSATFKPIRSIGLKGMVGYRKTIFNQQKDFLFDGIFTSLGLNVDFREIIKDVKMIRLKNRYHHGREIENAVDMITD